jgi:DNA-binding NtrC family response regulator
MTRNVLIVDDETIVLKSCARILTRARYTVQTCQTGQEALKCLRTERFDLVLTDLKMPEMSGMEFLEQVMELEPDMIVIMMTGYSTVETAVEAMKLGAYDYVSKPFKPEELIKTLENAFQKKQQEKHNLYPRATAGEDREHYHELIGKSERMQEIYDLIKRVAPTQATVLIEGESGTGKELAARAIHAESPRKDRRFVAADCSALPQDILESELFGHVKGSFTGATHTRPGLFEVADGGTLFLDEVSNTGPELQGKLLRVLEEREFKPVGSSETKHVDVRFVAATNRDLKALVAEGKFREDLFYRLNVFPVTVPPLRGRRGDIPLLAHYFLDQFCQETNKQITGFTPKAMDLLMQYHWPGNVRELKNVIGRLVILADGDLVNDAHIKGSMKEYAFKIKRPAPRTSKELKEAKKKIREAAAEELERAFVMHALSRNDWNATKAAQETGMQRPNFQALMRKHGVRIKDLQV